MPINHSDGPFCTWGVASEARPHSTNFPQPRMNVQSMKRLARSKSTLEYPRQQKNRLLKDSCQSFEAQEVYQKTLKQFSCSSMEQHGNFEDKCVLLSRRCNKSLLFWMGNKRKYIV